MKKLIGLLLSLYSSIAFSQTTQPYILEHENDIAKNEAGTHSGGGSTVGYSFFSKADGLKMVFRLRCAVFDHVQRLSLAFHDATTVGDSIYRVAWDTYSVRRYSMKGWFRF